MKMKKVISLLLTVTMLNGLLAGCGQEQQTAGNQENTASEATVQKETETTAQTSETESNDGRISKETITITVSGPWCGGSTGDWNDTVQFAEYEKRLGLKFDATTYDQEQWGSKFTLMMASDEMTDIICQASIKQNEVQKYGEEGYFLDFSQYLDIMPNFKKILDENPDYAAHLKNEDGEIYALTLLNKSLNSGKTTPVWMNKKWLDNLGLDVPKTIDDLYNVLVAFKEQDANGNGDATDEIPMGVLNSHTSLLPIIAAFGIPTNDHGFFRMIDENGKVYLADTTDNYKAYLKYVHKLYKEELINNDMYVTTSSELIAKFREDKIGIYSTWSTLPGNISEDWIALAGFTSEYNTESIVAVPSSMYSDYTFAVNANTEYPEEIAKFVDYLYTEEGSLSAFRGFEGASFDFVDLLGTKIYDHTNYSKEFASNDEYRAYKAVAVQAFELLKTDKGTVYELMANTPSEKILEEEYFQYFGQDGLKEIAYRDAKYVDMYPIVSYLPEEAEERTTIYTDMRNYIQTMVAQFITGEVDIDEGWDEHLAQLKEIGLDRILEIEQDAYDRKYGK